MASETLKSAPRQTASVPVRTAASAPASPAMTLKAMASPVRPGAVAAQAPAAQASTTPARAKPAQPSAEPQHTTPQPKVATQLKPSTPTPAKPATTPASPTAPIAQPARPTFQLPSAIYSPQLLESVIYDLQYYLDWIRQNHIRKSVGAKPKDEPNHSDETVLAIEAWLAGKPATVESIEALLDYLHNLKLPEVHIMLAALPNRTQRIALVDWFRNNTTQELLLSFVADRNLGGGIVIRTPNRVFDFTWKQQLVAGRDKLAGILKHV